MVGEYPAPTLGWSEVLRVNGQGKQAPLYLSSSALRHLESVAYLADSLDQQWSIGVLLDLLSQSRDTTVNTSPGNKNISAPDVLEDPITRQSAAGVLNQKGQKA